MNGRFREREGWTSLVQPEQNNEANRHQSVCSNSTPQLTKVKKKGGPYRGVESRNVVNKIPFSTVFFLFSLVFSLSGTADGATVWHQNVRVSCRCAPCRPTWRSPLWRSRKWRRWGCGGHPGPTRTSCASQLSSTVAEWGRGDAGWRGGGSVWTVSLFLHSQWTSMVGWWRNVWVTNEKVESVTSSPSHSQKDLPTVCLTVQAGEEVAPVARVHEGTGPPRGLAADCGAGRQWVASLQRPLCHCQGGTSEVWGEPASSRQRLYR